MKNMLSLLALAGIVSVTGTAHAQGPKGDIKAAEGKVAMCIGCHGIPGYQASFPEIHRVPMISGQTAAYLVNSLTAYQKGERKHPTMRGIAGSLSEQDIDELAADYAQHGRAKTKPGLLNTSDAADEPTRVESRGRTPARTATIV